MGVLRFILGDQLTREIAALDGLDPSRDVVLMAEVAEVKAFAKPHETLLVLDATTGQNAMAQAKAFAEVANVTGIVLTKLDGTAKGGIVYSIQRELGIPVKLVGVGEGIRDFAFFDAREFASGLVG